MDPLAEFKRDFEALSPEEKALLRALFTGQGVDEAIAALQEEDDTNE